MGEPWVENQEIKEGKEDLKMPDPGEDTEPFIIL